MSEKTRESYRALFEREDLDKLDPEFSNRFDYFAFEEVINCPRAELDDKTRAMVILAVLMGCQGLDAFGALLKPAMKMGLTPVEIKEVVYQGVDYLGLGRVYPFLLKTNEVFKEEGIDLPLAPQATTTLEDRLEKGEQAQVDIFGEQMKGFASSGPRESKHINAWLSANCFGDYYTRKGLDFRQRELITFCFLYAQGGCEPQLMSHTKANLRIGNDKEFLIACISNAIPYIGYPRTLNALRIISEASF